MVLLSKWILIRVCLVSSSVPPPHATRGKRHSCNSANGKMKEVWLQSVDKDRRGAGTQAERKRREQPGPKAIPMLFRYLVPELGCYHQKGSWFSFITFRRTIIHSVLQLHPILALVRPAVMFTPISCSRHIYERLIFKSLLPTTVNSPTLWHPFLSRLVDTGSCDYLRPLSVVIVFKPRLLGFQLLDMDHSYLNRPISM